VRAGAAAPSSTPARLNKGETATGQGVGSRADRFRVECRVLPSRKEPCQEGGQLTRNLTGTEHTPPLPRSLRAPRPPASSDRPALGQLPCAIPSGGSLFRGSGSGFRSLGRQAPTAKGSGERANCPPTGRRWRLVTMPTPHGPGGGRHQPPAACRPELAASPTSAIRRDQGDLVPTSRAANRRSAALRRNRRLMPLLAKSTLARK
jgi:hypothetical protein